MTKLYNTKYQVGDKFLFEAEVVEIDAEDGNTRNYKLMFDHPNVGSTWTYVNEIETYNKETNEQKKERLQKEMARLQEQLKLKQEEIDSL